MLPSPAGTHLADQVGWSHRMPDPSFVGRIEILEQKVEGVELLPARMTGLESQILQLDSDMRAEFSAMRQEMATAISQLEERIRSGDEETRRYAGALHHDVIKRLLVLEERISSGDEETRRYMRVLHEDVIERISRIQEGPPPRRRKR
jgi:hypothetical protein